MGYMLYKTAALQTVAKIAWVFCRDTAMIKALD